MNTNKKIYRRLTQNFSLTTKTVPHRSWHWYRIVLLVILVTFFSSLVTPTIASAQATNNTDTNQDNIAIDKSDETEAGTKTNETNTNSSKQIDKNSYKSIDWNSFSKIIYGLLVGNKIGDIADRLIEATNNTTNTQEKIDSSIADIKKIIDPLTADLQKKTFNSPQERTDFIASTFNSTELNALSQDVKNNINHIAQDLYRQDKNDLIKDLEVIASDIRHFLEENSHFISASIKNATTTIKTDPKNDGTDSYIQYLREQNSLYEFAHALSLKTLEIAVKATSSRNPYTRIAGYSAFGPLATIPKIEHTNTMAAWAGKAMALSMVYDEHIFYTYIKAKIIGEIARCYLNNHMPLYMGYVPRLGIDVRTLIIEIIVAQIELRILDATDICTVSGAILEVLLSVSEHKWLSSSATAIGALLTARCKLTIYNIGMAAQRSGFTNPGTLYYLCASQLNNDGSSLETCDNQHWHVTAVQERLHSTEQVVADFPANPEDTSSNRLRNAYRQGITSLVL
ncbi:hypothetical protein GAMM_40058 [Gammaproteobacteria bacterium]